MQRSESCDGFVNKFYKNFTIFLFFILPNRLSLVFAKLSIVAAIYNIKNIEFTIERLNNANISEILRVSIDDEILLLPNYTINWFWTNSFLNKEIELDNRRLKIKEAVYDNELFFAHIRRIIDYFIDNLPKLLKIKLNLNNEHNRMLFKHNIMNILIHS